MKATINHPPPVEPPPAVVNIEISQTEARMLQQLVSCHVYWNTGETGRFAERLSKALEKVGLEPFQHDYEFMIDRT